MYRILIADDHALVREGFRKLLSAEVGINVIGEAHNGLEVLDFLGSNDVDLVVLDLSLPGKSGLELLREFQNHGIDVKVLILTMHPEDRFALRALKAGANGYLTKSSAYEELIKAINSIMTTGRYISPAVAAHLAENYTSQRPAAGHEKLSDREFEIFRMIAAGRTANEIASDLAISTSTVNTHRARILEKTGLKSNADIIHYAVDHHLIDR